MKKSAAWGGQKLAICTQIDGLDVSSSLVQDGGKMKKCLSVLAVVVTFSLPAFADVDCTSITVCTLDRGDGLCHPAVLFNVIAAQTVNGDFTACDDDSCAGTCSDPAPFSFDFTEGLHGVFLSFTDEPPFCTTLSTGWDIDACDFACGAHHCVTPDCPIGAKADLKEIVVKR